MEIRVKGFLDNAHLVFEVEPSTIPPKRTVNLLICCVLWNAFQRVYDRTLDVTTLRARGGGDFDKEYSRGTFPYDEHVHILFIAINASLTISATSPSSSNYVDFTYIQELEQIGKFLPDLFPIRYPSDLREFSKYGKVYRLVIDLEHTSDFKEFGKIAFFAIPGTFAVLFVVFAAALPLHVRQHRKMKTMTGGTYLDSSFFTATSGILIFMPIYLFTIRPLEAPLQVTWVDTFLSLLTQVYAALLGVALLFKWRYKFRP